MSGFGDRLREARTAIGLTQEQLGFAIGVTNSAVSAWENGRDVPSFNILPALRAALRTTLDSLVCGDGATAAKPGERVGKVREEGERYAHAAPFRQDADSAKEVALLQRFRGLSAKRQQALLELLKPAKGSS